MEDLNAGQRMARLSRIAGKLLNGRIDIIWKNPEDESISLLKETLTTGEKDTVQEVILKTLVFFLSCDKLPSTTEERFINNNGKLPKDPLMMRGKVRLRPELRYATSKTGNVYPVGNTQIDIPHVLEDKLDKLHGLSHTYGQIKALYIFGDGTQIKVNAITQKEAHRVINHCLLAVDPAWLLGTSEDHTYFGISPKKAEKSPLHDTVGNLQSIELHNQYGKVKVIWV